MFEDSHPPRVLIGEDQQDVQDALHLLLRGAGYSADGATTPDSILSKLDSTPYDLVLMDLNYRRDTTSGTEGLEILGMLRNLPSPPPVIVMTAWGSIELAVQAMHMGARDFIQKPWDNNSLLHLAEKHITAHRIELQKRRRQEYELQDAIEVQRRLLPSILPRIPGVDVAAACKAAASIAGDYFDVLPLGDKLGLCIADVIGKGLPAALMMSNLQAAVKVTAADWLQPSELCRRVNTLACRNGSADKFISFFYALYDPGTRKLTYTNAGHNPPIVFRPSDSSVFTLDTPDLVLGQVPTWQYHDAECILQPGDCVLCYTDGITEAGNDQSEEFGCDRLCQLVRTHAHSSASDLLAQIFHTVGEHCNHHFADDATCLVFRIE